MKVSSPKQAANSIAGVPLPRRDKLVVASVITMLLPTYFIGGSLFGGEANWGLLLFGPIFVPFAYAGVVNAILNLVTFGTLLGRSPSRDEAFWYVLMIIASAAYLVGFVWLYLNAQVLQIRLLS
ncbi:MAG TPA: hypothetical protein VLA88_02135 [Candidatus Saccharimonadales bacterium]|nr:hypothetical protein [Candidatus Saccharimonadales bacterium]